MPGLGQGWTNNPSQFCGIQEVAITPKGSQGCWPWRWSSKHPRFSLCSLCLAPDPVMPGAAALRSLVDRNGFRQMCMNLSWLSPCDSERPITHLSKLMPSPVPSLILTS